MSERLDECREKRDFERTAEPSGSTDTLAPDGAPRFVIQHHDASSEHRDFRLEHDGALLSWAVPKGPSFTPPILATLVDTAVQGDEWIFERKLDGIRLVIVGDADRARSAVRLRKSLLRDVIGWDDPLQFCPHRNGGDGLGVQLLSTACEKGWEGLIAKRADAPYSGGRSRDLLKLKCVARQEFVIGGFTDPKGSRLRHPRFLGLRDDKDPDAVVRESPSVSP
ncbi:MAG: DNA polymerase ligase N-terminal domain-containing protein [Ilumatobacter sp.]|uniref:DNA polymerase ligase N-terminal domain-containing protein n=1 Tax=Ilumatobacter sp. TaxID=1967498 RepID=UPI003C722F37